MEQVVLSDSSSWLRPHGRSGLDVMAGHSAAVARPVSRFLAFGLGALATACLLLGALIPTDVSVEAYLAVVCCVSLLLLARKPRTGLLRGLTLTICMVLTLRYFAWRFSDTLVYFDPLSMIAGICLLMAELYSLAMTLLGLFANAVPITRTLDLLPLDASDPMVDVVIPSYNEEADLLAVTLCAATQIQYPAGRLRVHLLDDGGTDAKCADRDPVKAQAARARRATLQALCAKFGATYRTRLINDHAKAGNINFALPRLEGELVLILDADHVPTADILARTVPFYRHDPKLFLVQTPHFFMNPDTIEKNLDLFLKMPGENEMFHRAIQSGLDFWNATVFVGSAAVLHRGRLLEVGGIATNTITEDAETALALHARGYNSACVARPMVAGLAPETFTGMVVQRVRWAQGMLQILLLQNPIGRPGLTLPQRLGYLNSTFYWLFPFARVVFLGAPVAYLIFGLKIYAASVPGILVFAIPHIHGSFVSSSMLFKRFRWPMVSHVYETLLGMLMLRPLVATLRSPRAPDFKVTPKGEQLDSDFISPLVKPFYLIFAVILAALPIGLVRVLEDGEHRYLLLITLGWEIFNLLVMTAALGALFERKQRRTAPRLDSDLAAILTDGADAVPGRLINLSIGGASFVPAGGSQWAPSRGKRLSLRVTAPHEAEPVQLAVEVRSHRNGSEGLFFAESEAEFRKIVSLVHGDSGRWVSLWERESRSSGAFAAFLMMTRTGLRALGAHIPFLFRQLFNQLAALRALPRDTNLLESADAPSNS